MFYVVVSQDIGRVRRRWLRSQASPMADGTGPITSQAGTTLQLPSGDENAPELHPGAPELHPPSSPPWGYCPRNFARDAPVGFLEFSPDFGIASVSGKCHTSRRTPKRSDDDLAAPSPQRPRTDSHVAEGAGGAEFGCVKRWIHGLSLFPLCWAIGNCRMLWAFLRKHGPHMTPSPRWANPPSPWTTFFFRCAFETCPLKKTFIC